MGKGSVFMNGSRNEVILVYMYRVFFDEDKITNPLLTEILIIRVYFIIDVGFLRSARLCPGNTL